MSAAMHNGHPAADTANLLRYNRALAAAGIGVWEVDLTTGMVTWDDCCRTLFGLPPGSDARLQEAIALIHPADRPRIEASLQSILRGNGDGKFDEQYRVPGAADGVIRHIRATGELTFGQDGTPLCFSGIAQNLTGWMETRERSETIERTAQTALDSTGAGWFRISMPDGRLEHSPELARITTGNAEKKFSRETLAGYVHPDDQATRLAAYGDAEKTDVLNYTTRFVWDDGSVHWVRVAGRYHHNEAGEINLFTGTAQDVTGQRRAEQELRRKESAIAASNNGIVITGNNNSPDSPIIYVNPAFERMTGYSAAEILGQDCRFLQAGDRDQPEINILRQAIKEGKPTTVVLRNYRKDGSLFYNELAISPVVEDGVVKHFVGIQTDITGRRATEEALRLSEERYQTFVRQSSEGIWRFEISKPIPTDLPIASQIDRILEHAHFAECNDAMAQMHGFDNATQIMGAPWSQIVPRNAENVAYLTHFIQSGYRVMNVESKESGRDGHARFFMNNLLGIVQDGMLQRAWGTQRDVTEERERGQALAESEARFRSIFNGQFLFLAMLAPDGRVLDINELPLRAIGAKREDVLGKIFWDTAWWHNLPEMQARWPSRLAEAAAAGGPVFSEDHFQTESGEVRVADAAVTAVRGEDGAVEFFIVQASDITERKRAEQTVRESEARFRSLIEEAPVATCLFVGRELRVDIANEAIKAVWGKGDEVIGKPLAEALPEMQGQPFLRILDDVFTTGEAYHSTAAPATIVRDGVAGTYYFDFTYKPLRDAAGVVYAIMNMAVDVTEQVLAQRRVEESQRQLLSLFEQSPVGIALLHADEGLTFEVANPFYGTLVGRSPEELTGKPLLEALPELKDQGFDALLRGVISTGKAYIADEVAVDLRRGDGIQTLYVDLAYQPRTDASGKVNGILVVATNVTAQVEVRRKIEESEAYFRRLTDTVPAIIWITQPDGYCTYLNQNWYDYTGQSREEAEGFGWLDATHPDDKERTGKMFVDANAARKPFNALYRLRHASGEYRWAIDSGQPKFGADGTYEGMIGTVVDVHEQQTAEKKVRASEARFRSVIEAAPVAIGLFVGRDLIIETPNQTFIDIVGKGWDVVGKPLREAMPELLTEGQPFLKILDDIFTTGVAFESPASQVKILRGGVMTENYYNISYQPLFNEAGEVYAILDVALDVTEQVLSQQRVEKSEENLRSLVEGAPFPIGVYVGKEMRIQLANQAILDTWSKGHEAVGKLFAEVLPELKGSGIYEQLDSVYTTGKPFHARQQRVDLEIDGVMKPHYFNYSFTPLHDGEGQVYGVMNTAAELTDLITAKQQVDEAEAALRSAIELAELGTWEIDIATGTLVFSERLQEWFGFDEAKTNFGVVYNPIHERDRDRVAAAVARAQEPGSGGTYDEEYTLVAQNTGRERVVHAQGKTFFDETGKAVRMTGTAQDVTKQRALQAELERQVQERTAELDATARNLTRSNEELSQYAYVASHDLQEPLRKIQMFSGILNGQKELPEAARGTVARISGAAERMSTLIQSLLEFSRLQRTDVMTRPVDLSTVASEVVQDFELMIEERGAVVDVGELPVVEGVGLQMNQLFYNLIGNALKFVRRDVVPEVRIVARTIPAAEADGRLDGPPTAARYHHITVTDNGIGFEVRYTEQIFEVFKRLHGRDAFPGSGIGLALCRRIVANHGGALWADSELGQGSTFNILLPDTGLS